MVTKAEFMELVAKYAEAYWQSGQQADVFECNKQIDLVAEFAWATAIVLRAIPDETPLGEAVERAHEAFPLVELYTDVQNS
jgi:hypothetical protein